MLEMGWLFGYSFALLVMLMVSAVLHLVFKQPG
jgi:Mg2+ and Co2+ transporter CorA